MTRTDEFHIIANVIDMEFLRSIACLISVLVVAVGIEGLRLGSTCSSFKYISIHFEAVSYS